MAVRIRMKRLGRKHRPFFRVVAIDSRTARDGKVIEELGYYDPMVPETDARAILKADRIDYWLSVGALPGEQVSVLIKKYGTEGTHRDAQQSALERLKGRKAAQAAAEANRPKPKPQPVAAAVEASSNGGEAEGGAEEAVSESETSAEGSAEE